MEKGLLMVAAAMRSCPTWRMGHRPARPLAGPCYRLRFMVGRGNHLF